MIEDCTKRIEHVNVNNETSIYEDRSFIPECIVTVDVNNEDTIICHDREYHLYKDINGMKMYVITD